MRVRPNAGPALPHALGVARGQRLLLVGLADLPYQGLQLSDPACAHLVLLRLHMPIAVMLIRHASALCSNSLALWLLSNRRSPMSR